MNVNDPQFLYIFLILPALFGVTLIGEGICKVINEEWSGLINLVLGMVFIGFVVIAYFMFMNFFAQKI